MKIKLSELLGKKEALEALINTKVSGVIAFRLDKDIKAVNTELASYQTAHDDLVKKFGKDEAGQYRVEPNTPEMADFLKELQPLLDEEVELDVTPIKLEELGKDFSLEAKYIIALKDFVIEE